MNTNASLICAGIALGLSAGAFAMGVLRMPGVSLVCTLAFVACMAAILFGGSHDDPHRT